MDYIIKICLNNRNLKKLIILIFFSLIFFNCKKEDNTKEKPNILWLVFEDMSPQFVGAYGNEAIKTPVMDSLINAGTRFDAAFSTGAVCSPSRYTIITGTRTNEYGTGHHRSNYPIPENILPFPKYLRDSGYYTTNNSKRDYNHKGQWQTSKKAWDESSEKAGWWNRENKPFFSVFNFNNSHQSRTFTNPYKNYKARILDKLDADEIVKPEDIILPTFYKDTPEMRKELSRTYNAMKKTDKEMDTLLTKLKKDGLLENTIIFLYSDHGGGSLRTKTEGIPLGHQVPMAVVFPKKYQHLNHFKGVKRTNQPVTFEDLGPTVLELAGIEKPEFMTGASFLGKSPTKHEFSFSSSDRSGEDYDLTRSVSDGEYFYTRVFYPNKPMISWFKYFDYSKTRQLIRGYYDENSLNDIQRESLEERPTEFLYHLKDDFWQENNLADNEAYSDHLNKLRNVLDEKLLAIKDVMFLPEYAMDSIAKVTTPYEFKVTYVYDFKNIYKTAKMVGSSENFEAQLEALQDENAIIRYWALVGLSNYDKVALSKHRNQITKALSDIFIPNRVLSASILYYHFNDKKAKKLLREKLNHENQFIASQVVQELIYYPKEKAIPFLNDIETLLENYKKAKKSGNVTEGCDVYLYKFTGKPLFYATHW